jgi:hypothetical protein
LAYFAKTLPSAVTTGIFRVSAGRVIVNSADVPSPVYELGYPVSPCRRRRIFPVLGPVSQAMFRPLIFF